MEDFLITLLQSIIEFIIEMISSVTFGWPFLSPVELESEGIVGRCFTWFILGCGLAGLSLLLLKHTWIIHPVLRMVNLLLAPVTAGSISKVIARRRARHNPFIIPRNHFWTAFCFTLGIVVVRFAYAVRR